MPFVTANQVASIDVGFTMADGRRFAAQVPPLWIRGAWRAAVLPADLTARHGGVASIRLTAQNDPSLMVDEPRMATLRPAWSKLY